jgi:SAM-dependent methyltransferase
LRSAYQLQFEAHLGAVTSLRNYEYLDILDRAFAQGERPRGGVLCDVGCANFAYAAALHAFFRPVRLIGVEVEGHRLYRDGHSRIDYAAGYLSRFEEASFLVADYRKLELKADVITAWFPFLTATALLAWRLPLSLLEPQGLMARIYHNLNPGGWLVMVNHGEGEAAAAHNLCEQAGLAFAWRSTAASPLSAYRPQAAVVSAWRKVVAPALNIRTNQ